MFTSKKFMALCATTLAGVSALGSFAPMAASADAAKNGETVITYEGAQKPEEWGLSVPATVNLDKIPSNGSAASRYGNAKLAIVSSDANTDFKGTTDKTFVINGSVLYKNGDGKMLFKNAKDESITTDMYGMLDSQTADAAEPTAWNDPAGQRSENESLLKNIEIQAPADGSLKPARWLQIYGDDVATITPEGDSMTNTISWTANEK